MTTVNRPNSTVGVPPRQPRANRLLDEPWMPVRKRDGGREWVNPTQLSRPDIVAFDADRADFNGALAQFAIGLLQTTAVVERDREWRALLREAPSSETLAQWFAPVRNAFEFDGDGARFMQDCSLTAEDGTACDIASLLIEAPGENTIKDNKDLFIKRDRVTQLCPHCAITALFTLQTNAPSGGAGHRTGLRGGGPLTTLLLAPADSSLWHHLWLNVIERARFFDGESAPIDSTHLTFPWLAPISAIQKEDSATAPAQLHPAHVFWAMPRRIRFIASGGRSGECGICGRFSDALLSSYLTRNYGLNYKGGWNHPLSPYYQLDEDWLPLHPQSGGLGYRHWLAWLVGQTSERKKQRRARVVEHFLSARIRTAPGALRLWAFGFDLDNMKARCWYESTLPLYGLVDCDAKAQETIEAEVGRWLDAAELAGSQLRGCIKDAWFKEAPSKADFSAIDAAFWGATEAVFYGQLRVLIECAGSGARIDSTEVNTAWLDHLNDCAKHLFDHQFVGTGPVAQQQPRRIAEAHQQLLRNLNGPKLRQSLGLPVGPAHTAARKTARVIKPKEGRA